MSHEHKLNRVDFCVRFQRHEVITIKPSSSSISKHPVLAPSHLIKHAVYVEIVAGACGVCDKSSANFIKVGIMKEGWELGVMQCFFTLAHRVPLISIVIAHIHMQISGVSSSKTKENWITESWEWAREQLWTCFVLASQHPTPFSTKLRTSCVMPYFLEAFWDGFQLGWDAIFGKKLFCSSKKGEVL